MKINKFIFIGSILLLFTLNVGILHQGKKLKDKTLEELYSRQRTEWCLFDGIRNIGKDIPLDSISYGHHFILRYDMTTCMPCLIEAEALLENVFGRNWIMEELCIIGVEGFHTPFDRLISTTLYNSILTPMDDIYTPYFCFVNDNGEILFSLALQPENYEFNREILLRLKNTLIEQGKSRTSHSLRL